MAMDHNQGRRGHFHRGRRGPIGAGSSGGSTPAEPVQPPRADDRVDVEQIMRDIRGAHRAAQRHRPVEPADPGAGRAAARGDSRSAGTQAGAARSAAAKRGERTVSVDAAAPAASQSYPFDEATLYDSPNGLLRFLRRLLNPILRMLFNPTPIAQALAVQSRLNASSRRGKRSATAGRPNGTRFTTKSCSDLPPRSRARASRRKAWRCASSRLRTKVDFNERRVRTWKARRHATPRPQEASLPAQSARRPNRPKPRVPQPPGPGRPRW